MHRLDATHGDGTAVTRFVATPSVVGRRRMHALYVHVAGSCIHWALNRLDAAYYDGSQSCPSGKLLGSYTTLLAST